MMKWQGRAPMIAGFVLILVTNAVALGGVIWNRHGDPESVLSVSQRELEMPYRWASHENSGVALTLRWRVAAKANGNAAPSGSYGYAPPDWLDEAKMRSLGFTLRAYADDTQQTEKALSHDVLLVLEMAGDAYGRALEQARRYVAAEEAKLDASPVSEENKRRRESLRRTLREEEHENSRLFVVDAGLDAAELRARYPDRSRYAIVKGQVRPWASGSPASASATSAARGVVSGISATEINVPYRFRPLFAGRWSNDADYLQYKNAVQEDTAKFEARVAFGQRYEPWITDVNFSSATATGKTTAPPP